MSASGFLDELDECLAKIAQRSLFELAQEPSVAWNRIAHTHQPQRIPHPRLGVGHHRLAVIFFNTLDDGDDAPLVTRHVNAVHVRILAQQSSRQIVAARRRQLPNHIGVRTAEAAKGDDFDTVMLQKFNQPLVLIFGKRRGHDDALKPKRPAASHDCGQNRGSRRRRDGLDQVENFQV